jgi:serine/threonine protein kinase
MTGEQFGPYRLISLLGSGGMSEVWRAVDVRKDRPVALKVLRGWLAGDEEFADRFRREAALAAKLTGPNIVPIHDYGEIDGRLFIDMPLLEGADLGVVLERDGPLPAERAVGITAQVARALDLAHRAGLVHRDVKPSNILVCDSGGDDHAYLIDFGISRALDGAEISLSGSFTGTPAYMAPERFAGEGDHRSDIYALGCMLYEALTGIQPFTATNPLTFMNAHQNIPAPRPTDRLAGIPSGLDDVIARAMAKAPDERYSSASALASAARDALASPAATTVSSPLPVGPPINPPKPDARRGAEPTLTRGPRTDGSLPGGPPPPAQPSAAPAVPRRRTLAAALTALVAVGLLTASVTIFIRPGPPESGSVGPTRDAPLDPSPDPPASTRAAPIDEPIEERTIVSGDTHGVEAVASAQLDGRPVIVSGGDSVIRVWDLATGEPIGQPLTGHTDSVIDLATTELEGRPVIVSGSFDEPVRVWDLATGRAIGRPLTGHDRPVYAVTTTQLDDRPVVISGGFDDTVRVWDLASGSPIGRPLTGHTNGVLALATAALDGRPVIVSGSIDGTVGMWDLASGDPLGRPLASHTDEVDAVATAESHGRPVIISGGVDGTVRVWDPATGGAVGPPLIGHTSNVLGLATAQLDGQSVIVSAGFDGTVRMWYLATGVAVGQPFTGHTHGVLAVATAQLEARTVIITGSVDNTIRTWDLSARARM